MTRRKKFLVFAGAAFLLLLIALIVAIPFLIDVDRHRPRIAAYIEEQTGKPTQIGRLTLTIFPRLSIRVDDIVLGNPQDFPEGEFFRAHRIFAELDREALWDRRVIVRSLEIDDPVISLLSTTRGKWNFENPESPAPPPQPAAAAEESSEPAFTLGIIDRVTLTGGKVSAARVVFAAEAEPSYFEADNLSTELTHVDLNAFTTSQTARVIPPVPSPAEGSEARDPHSASLLSTSYSLLPVVYAQGAETTGPEPAARGTLKADAIRFGSFSVSSLATQIRLFPRQVSLDDLNFGLYQGNAAGGLSFDFSGTTPAYAVAAQLTGIDVARLLESFPDARGKMTGTLDGGIELNGVITNSPDPLAGASGMGQIAIRDGNLPSLNLNQNLMRLARFTQLGPAEGDPASFSAITSDFAIADQRITTEQLHIVGNGVEITATGSLALSASGILRYEGLANVVAGDNPVSGLIAGLSGATFVDGKLSFPFTLTGTLEQPNFRLKSATPGNALRGLQNFLGSGQQTTPEGQTPEGQTQSEPATPGNLIRGLTNIFGGSKQQQTQPTQP